MSDLFSKEIPVVNTFNTVNKLQIGQQVYDVIQIPQANLSVEDQQKHIIRQFKLDNMEITIFPGLGSSLLSQIPMNDMETNYNPGKELPSTIYVMSEDGSANVYLNGQYRCCLGLLRKTMIPNQVQSLQGSYYRSVFYELTEKYYTNLKLISNQMTIGLFILDLESNQFKPIINGQTPLASIKTTLQQAFQDVFTLRDQENNLKNDINGNVLPITYTAIISTIVIED